MCVRRRCDAWTYRIQPYAFQHFCVAKICIRTRRFEKTLCRVCGFGMKTENRNIQLAEGSGSNGTEEPLPYFGMCVCASLWCSMSLINKCVTCERSQRVLYICLIVYLLVSSGLKTRCLVWRQVFSCFDKDSLLELGCTVTGSIDRHLWNLW
jgi:hypothetical protein